MGAGLPEYTLPETGSAGSGGEATTDASAVAPSPVLVVTVVADIPTAEEPEPLTGLTNDSSLVSWCDALAIAADLAMTLRKSLGLEDLDKFSVGTSAEWATILPMC